MVQGIRDTPMPPANLSDTQAHQVVAYLRSLAAAADTSPASKRISRTARRCSKAKAV